MPNSLKKVLLWHRPSQRRSRSESVVHYSSEATSKASVPEKTAQAASDQTPRGSASGDIKFSKGDSYGVHVLYDPPAQAVVDIVFLHGLTGNAYTTWLHERANVHWPRDCLKNDIPEARIMSFGYDANVANLVHQASTSRINNHADDLLGTLSQHRAETGTQDRKIIFVAHSLGGLVVETAIASSKHSTFSYRKQIEKNTVGIIFMGTPHLGTDAAKWMSLATNILKFFKRTNVDIVQVLRPDSEMLAQIQKNFHGVLIQRLGEQDPIGISCFHEELAVTLVGNIVPQYSAILQGYDSIGIKGNHTDMTKFAGPTDKGYRAVVGEIRRPISMIRQANEALLSTQTDSTTPSREMASYGLDDILPLARDLFDVSQDTLRRRGIENAQQTPWFLTSAEFVHWRHSKCSEFLWFSGHAGTERTSTAAILASEILGARSYSEYVAHYFLEPSLKVAASSLQSTLMICFIVAQLIHEHYGQTAIHDNVLTQIEFQIISEAFACAKMIISILSAPNVSSEDTEKKEAISTLHSYAHEDLWKILESITQASAGRHTFIVIDGVDELWPEHQTRLLKDLRNLWESARAKSVPALKILITARPLPRIQELLNGVPYIAPDKEQKKCLASLRPGSSNSRRSRIASNEEHTAEWIWKHHQYLGWRSHETSALLWVQGKPGSGKSVLMKHLLQELQHEANLGGSEHDSAIERAAESVDNIMEVTNHPPGAEGRRLIASFFYSARDGELETSHQHMLQALLYQLLEQEQQLYPCFREVYQSLLSATNGRIIWDYHNLEQVWKLIAAWDKTPQVFLLVDALDESDQHYLSEFLSLLLDHQ